MKHLLILIAALMLSGCTNEDSKAKSAPAGAPAAALHYDGVYQSEKKSDYWSYIRFYEDGSVISTSTSGQPADIKKWFTKDHEGVAIGKSTRNGTHISFSLKASTGAVDYEGEVDGDKLVLNSHSQINDNRAKTEYHFVKW